MQVKTLKSLVHPLGAALLALLALSACVELEQMKTLRTASEPPPPIESPAPVAPPPVVTAQEDLPPIPQRKPDFARRLRQQLEAERRAQARKVESPPKPETKTVIVDPNALIGLDFEKTANILGSPTRLIEQPPALVWAYDEPNCALRVFFYPRVAGSEYRALAYKIEDAGGAQADGNDAATRLRLRTCLNKLIAHADGSKHLVKIVRERAHSP